MDDEDSSKTEAELKMEMQRKKQQEKEDEELKEYEEQRKAEKEQELEEIQKLKERREQRRKEREEEERRMAELRVAEEQRRKQEEEERIRHKREEEAARRDANERRKRDAETRMSNVGKRNFVIEKRSEDRTENADNENEFDAANPQAKSKEQLETEKQEALKQRIQPLNIDGMEQAELAAKAKQVWNDVFRLESEKYDLEQRYKKQRDDVADLAERSRQLNKGSGSGKGKQTVPRQEQDQQSEKFPSAPPKVQMYSPYERVKDRRSFVEKRDCYTGPMYAPETTEILPKSEGDQEEGNVVENSTD